MSVSSSCRHANLCVVFRLSLLTTVLEQEVESPVPGGDTKGGCTAGRWEGQGLNPSVSHCRAHTFPLALQWLRLQARLSGGTPAQRLPCQGWL